MFRLSLYLNSKYWFILKKASIAAIVKKVSTTVPPATMIIKIGDLNITFKDYGFMAVSILKKYAVIVVKIENCIINFMKESGIRFFSKGRVYISWKIRL